MASDFLTMILLLILLLASAIDLVVSAESSLYNFPIAKLNCVDRCGDVRIPFPFGLGSQDCYHNGRFFTSCNRTFYPPKLFIENSTVEITDISLDGQITVLNSIAKDCYSNGTIVSSSNASLEIPEPFIVNYTANKFTTVGCDTVGVFGGDRLNRTYATGCTTLCYAKGDFIDGPSCTGAGCCQIPIPKGVWKVEMAFGSVFNYTNISEFNECGYAFVADERAFSFSANNLTSLMSNVEEFPMVVDWSISNGSCEEAKANISNYACRSEHSECYEPNNAYGYRCSCTKGYDGNPYLTDSCKDIDECQANLHNCEKDEYCKNSPAGNFTCKCPKGYRGDGIKGGKGCYRRDSLALKLVAGISSGIVGLMLAACWLHLELRRRRLARTRERFFRQNGGTLLREKFARMRSSDAATIFSETELQKATNHFHNSRIIGQGGFAVVYKGILRDNRVIAIKTPKLVDQKLVDEMQVDQFVNEVIILSQINHRNVVKFLGCCVETPVPLLVYEFITNGTLFEHIHDKARSRFLTWEIRVRIATEVANVLSYLHSSASTPIIHRDVKSANILLDNNFTAKVSDFGASRLIPVDQTQLNTMVQGTWGYLDPEYMLTTQLTEKSDVYSFGVVLVELLTGMKALSYDRSEEDRNLANFFLSAMQRDKLFEVLDDSVGGTEGDNGQQITRVALLAKGCLCLRGEDRPNMKEVSTELEIMVTREAKHSRENNVDVSEYLFGGFSGSEGGNNTCSSAAFDMMLEGQSGR